MACIVEQVPDAEALTGNVCLADASEPDPDVVLLPDIVGLADTAEHAPDVALLDTVHEVDNAEQVRDVALLTDSVVLSVQPGKPSHIVAVQRFASHVQ